MNKDQYPTRSSAYNVFHFESIGEKGIIVKLVSFDRIQDSDVFNLGFGDYNPKTGLFDDKAISNNGDMTKILATVASCVINFLEKNPEYSVFAMGSTESRTRLYQMQLNKYFSELKISYNLYGLMNNRWSKFQKGTNYSAFMLFKKK